MTDYIKLPRSALTDDLWANDGALLRVYMYLVKQSENGTAHVSTAQIIRATRLTERRVRDALATIETSNKTSSKRSNKTSSVINAAKPHVPDYISPPFVAPEFADTWRKFVEYRKEIKKPYKSESSERIAYNKMVEMSNNDPQAAKDMVERTILGQWQGLFPKDNHGTRSITATDTAATREASRDRMLGFANRIVSQSAGKLADLYNGGFTVPKPRQD